MGRPSIRTPEVEEEICNRLATGETLRAICSAPSMPAPSTVVEWTKNDPAFSERYASARAHGLDAMAEEIIEIADETSHDTITTERGDVPNSEWITRSRLRVDARKWLLSKMRPDKYGDRNAVELTGANGGPVESRHTIRFVDPKEAE